MPPITQDVIKTAIALLASIPGLPLPIAGALNLCMPYLPTLIDFIFKIAGGADPEELRRAPLPDVSAWKSELVPAALS